MAIFVCESGADKRKVFNLTAGTLVCGRSADVELPLLDPFLSGRHFSVTSKNGSWFVEDIGSANGLEVNDVKVSAAKLEDGDLLRAGSTYLRFYEHDESAAEAAREGLPVIDGYDISERIGVGGMGEVYRARQCSLDREVALKILSPSHARDREFVNKFFREARSTGSLNHPNIVQVHDVGECAGICYMCMEFVGGGDLTGRLRNDGKLAPDEVVRIIRDIAKGLEFAESRQIVHCDIKPDNIMFTEGGMAKIADLGIALSVSGYQERKKEVFGSPHYMAPEQAMGKPVDCRADLYALGCTMFRMLAGRTPFSGATAREVMKKQVVEEHPDVLKLAPDCSPALADIVDFLMEKKPEDRCPSATELLRLLDALQTHQAEKKSSVKKKRSGHVHQAAAAAVVAGAYSHGRARGPVQKSRRWWAHLPVGAKVAILLAVLIAALVIGKVVTSGDTSRQVFEEVEKRAAAGEYAEAIQLLQEFNAGRNKASAAWVATRLEQLRKAQAKSAGSLRFQRLWGDYLNVRSKATREELERKLDYMASLLDENYPDELRIINSERLNIRGMK